MLEINSLLPKRRFKDCRYAVYALQRYAKRKNNICKMALYYDVITYYKSYIQYLIPKQRNDNGYYAVIISLFINYNKIAMRRIFKTLPT